MSLILASASPRRKELLSYITPNFKVFPAKNEEKIDSKLPPCEAVIRVARQKALEVSAQFPDDVVIGADTTVFCDGIPLGKPKDEEDAKRMLTMLSAKTHQVITGVVITPPINGFEGFSPVCDAVKTSVSFYPLSEEMIDRYIQCGEYEGKAGAYGIQGKGALLIREIKGDYYNVMGLPIAHLYRELLAFNNILGQILKEIFR